MKFSISLIKVVKTFLSKPHQQEPVSLVALPGKTSTPAQLTFEGLTSHVTSHRSNTSQMTSPSGVSFMLEPPRAPAFPALHAFSSVECAEELLRCKKQLRQALDCKGDARKLLPALSELVARSAWPLEPLILLALAQRVAGEARACVKTCDRVLALDPENRFAVLHRTAALHAKLAAPDSSALYAADEKAQAWAAQHPDDSFAAIVASVFPTSPEEYEAAEHRLQRLLQKEPTNVCLLKILMAISTQWNDLEPHQSREQASLAYARQVVRINPSDDAARLLLFYDREGFSAQFPSRYCIAEPRAVLDYPLHLQDPAIEALFV